MDPEPGSTRATTSVTRTPREQHTVYETRLCPSQPASWLGKSDGLSANEGAIVALIVIGLSNQQIAGALHQSLHSVKTHIRSAYRTMGVTSRREAVAWGNLHGLRLRAGAALPDDRGPQ